MKRSISSLLSIAAAAMIVLPVAFPASVNSPAPSFSLVDMNGESHSLSDYSGKIVVLEWINHGCPYVKKHYKEGHMQALQANAAEKGVVWLSICSSAPGTQGHLSPDDWKATFNEKEMKSAAVLIDEEGAVGKLYGARTTPHMFVIDSEGVLVYNGAIDSIRSTDIEDNDKAENYVTAAVNALLAGEAVAVATTKPYGCGVKYAR